MQHLDEAGDSAGRDECCTAGVNAARKVPQDYQRGLLQQRGRVSQQRDDGADGTGCKQRKQAALVSGQECCHHRRLPLNLRRPRLDQYDERSRRARRRYRGQVRFN